MGGRHSDELTDKEAAFVAAFAAGKCAQQASLGAGYSDRSEGIRLLRRPAVQAALHAERAARIAGDGARLAWETLEGIMRDPVCAPAVRLKAATWTLEASGLGLAAQIAARTSEAPERALSELSLGELEAFIAKGREALAGLRSAHPAAVVDIGPASVSMSALQSADSADSADNGESEA